MKEGKLLRACQALIIASIFFTLLSAVFEGLLLVALVLFVIYAIREGALKGFRPKMEDYFLYAFALSALVSGIFAQDRLMAFGTVGIFAVYYAVFVFFRRLPAGGKFQDRLAAAAALGLTAVCGFSLVHFLLVRADITVSAFNLTYTVPAAVNGTLTSLLEHSTRGGYIISLLMLFLVSYTVRRWKDIGWKYRALLVAGMLVPAAALALTFSRVGMIFVAASVSVILILAKKWKGLIIVLCLGAAAAGGVITVKALGLHLLDTNVKDVKKISIEMRFQQYRRGFDLFLKSNKVFGIGLMNYKNEDVEGHSKDFIHNTYIALLVETGVSGLLLFMAFIVVMFVNSFRKAITGGSYGAINGSAMLCGFIITSFFDGGLLYSVPLSLVMWIILGLSLNESADYKPPEISEGLPMKSEGTGGGL